MRTDPRAEEVRAIVERVFSDYLASWPLRPMAEAVRGKGDSPIFADTKAGTVPTFPRLYEPAAREEEGEKGRRREGERDSRGAVCVALRPTRRAAAQTGPGALQIDETVRIDEGRYVARCYRVRGYLAMWLVAVGIVQFYDERGRMLATINLFETLRPKRIAA